MMIFALSKGHFSPSLRFFVDKNKKAKWQKCPIPHYGHNTHKRGHPTNKNERFFATFSQK